MAAVLVLGTLLVSVLLVGAGTFRLGFAGKLRQRLGPATYDFSKSWASTLTVLGAILGTTLGARDILPETLDSARFASLNLLFGLMVIVAPVVYAATQVAVIADAIADDGQNSEQKLQYQGFVGSFLVASAITLWAVLGQLATTLMLVSSIESGPGDALRLIIVTFQLFLLASLAFVLIYAWRSIGWTLKYNSLDRVRQELAEEMNKRNVPWPAGKQKAEELQPRLPEWSVM